METWTFFLSGLAAGLAIGTLAAALLARSRLLKAEAARAVAEARLSSAESAVSKIGETFQAMADTALRTSQGAFLEAAKGALETVRAEIAGDLSQRQTAVEGVVQPLSAALTKLEGQVRELDRARQDAYGALRGELQRLAQETGTLSHALRAPQVRGRWGEITLRRVAELAGMVKHCDFAEQETRETGEGRIRPDMLVRLPGGRTLAVDAKVPLTAFMEAASASDDAKRREALIRHSQQVLAHVNQLGGKQYWMQFQPAPEMVVLFLPGDHFFSAALEHNPALIEDALNRKVLLATPTTLISVLKGIGYGWRQQQLAENAEMIRCVAVEFYDRLQKLHGHYARTGQYLERAVQAYNESVASWEARVLPSLRRVRELGAAGGGEEPAAPGRIDLVPRSPQPVDPA
ncbi:MAG: DNA recombination protein RmuC [Bryobacterales bacterium]|nr:DNA recombination protein RmuC [Bryobacterales bacterium]